MKSLASYTKNNYNKFVNIDESLANNTRIITESQLVQEHGKYLDSAMNKFGLYTYNNLYNQNFIQESNNQVFELTLNEQNAVRDLFIYVCEDYKEQLLKELNIYENLLAGNESILTESLVNEDIVDNIKSVWAKGKEKAAEVVDNIKIKIEAVKSLIHDFASKTIKTVKDMADRAMELLEKFNCTISALFEKMGFDVKKQEASITAIGQELAKDPKKINNNDIYGFKSDVSESFESYARIISEAEEAGDTVNQKKGIKEMIWTAFKQFLIWASVCVVIPGIVCAVFPGTFIALLVPIACKLAWNGYKIYKLWKQWKEIRKNWDNYDTKKKWFTRITICISIIAIAINFDSLIGDSGTILSAFTKSGCDLLGKANLGIQPDVLTRGFAAGVKNIIDGKWPWEDFGKAFKGITDSFAEHIPQADKIIKFTAKAGQSGDEFLSKFEAGEFKTPEEFWDSVKGVGLKLSNVKDNDMVDVAVDGFFEAGKYGNKWSSKALEIAKELGMEEYLDPKQALNKGLNKIFSGQGSIAGFKMPGVLIKKLSDAGCLGNNNIFTILGTTTDVNIAMHVADVVNAATSMLITIPTVEITPENGGFRIRLGEKDSKNNIYEIGEKDIKVEKANTYKQYEEILKHTVGKNKQYIEQLEKALKEENSDDKKQEIKENIDKFKKEFDTIKNEDAYIFYGTKVEQSDVKESFKSLHDFLINEKLEALKSTTSKNEKDDESSNKKIENLFNGKELSDDDKKKVIELLKNKFKDLKDDEFKKLIEDIDKLADKLVNKKDEQTNESLIYESVSCEDILSNLKKLRDYLWSKASEWEKNDKETRQEYGYEKEKNEKSEYSKVHTQFQSIFTNKNIRNFDPKSDIINTQDNILSDAEINAVSLFFQKHIFTDFKNNGITKLKEAFIAIIKLKNWLLKNKDKELSKDDLSDAKTLYSVIINIFEKSDTFKHDVESGKFEKLDFDVDNKEKEQMQQKLDQQVDTVSAKDAKDDLKNVVSNDDSEGKKDSDKDSSNDLFTIYKDIINILLKNDKFKDDVKGDQKDLVKDPDITVEGYISLTDKLLLEDEESLTDKIKKKFKQLKEYILGKPLDSSDDEESDSSSNDDNSSSDSSSNNNNSSSDSSEEGEKENDGKAKPVLMIANNYVVDLADANDSGPRKETFTLPYLYENYEFITIEGKLSKENLITMFGKFIQTQTSRLYNYVVIKPCKKKKLSKKYKALDEPKGEREEFGNLTNADITAILNDSKKAREYVTGSTPNITEIAKDEEDIKYKDEKKKKYEEKLKNADEETVKMVKNIDKDAVDDNGKIKKEKISDLSDKLSSYKLAQHKAKKTKKSGGFFSKLKDFVKGLFGGNKDEGKKYNGLLSKFDESLNESKFDYDEFIEEMFAEKTFISFKDYVYEKYNKQ